MLDISVKINTINVKLQPIVNKIINEERISKKEGLILYTQAPLALLGCIANVIRKKKNDNKKQSRARRALCQNNRCLILASNIEEFEVFEGY